MVAIEYKQSPNGSTVKQGIGQSMMHTLCNDFDFVCYLFHGESNDKRIEKASQRAVELGILVKMWQDYNVAIMFI